MVVINTYRNSDCNIQVLETDSWHFDEAMRIWETNWKLRIYDNNRRAEGRV